MLSVGILLTNGSSVVVKCILNILGFKKMKDQAKKVFKGQVVGRPSLARLSPSSPEVGLGELLHVELLVCEGGQVDVTDGGEHFTWDTHIHRSESRKSNVLPTT